MEKSKLDPIDLENWYDRLKEYTFPTHFIPISPEEAKCIIDYYDDQRHFTEKMKSDDRMKLVYDMVEIVIVVKLTLNRKTRFNQ